MMAVYLLFDNSGHQVISEIASHEDIPDLVGKDLAKKIVEDSQKRYEARRVYRVAIRNEATEAEQDRLFKELEALPYEYSGLDLKVGGEGMKGFYDKMLPSAVNKYVKKWGAKVEDVLFILRLLPILPNR